MSRGIVALVLVFCAATQASAEQVWLVIGASAHSPASIAEKAKSLAPLSASGLVVQMGDCGQKRDVFAWVSSISTTYEEATAAAERLRESINDAYIKRCQVKPNSLLAFRISAIDSSIANVPKDAVNWEDKDRISTIYPLTGSEALIIVRHFANESEDPLEGRRESVVLAKLSGQQQILEKSCFNPTSITRKNCRLAFQCEREQAGENLFHSVVAFGAAGNKLADIEHCRNPQWSDSKALVCDSETIGADGVLTLHPQHVYIGDK